MHIAICDDNTEELAHIFVLLEEYRRIRGKSVTYEAFHSATELLETMKGRQFDLLLLDIIMPGITGIEAANEIRLWDKTIPIIFLTSSRDFAIESYSVNAENYILKPAKTAEIFSVLDKLLAKITRKETYLTLKVAGNLIRLPLSEIVCVEVMNRKVHFTLTSGEVKAAYGYLADFEKELLSSEHFIKPHRSYIVNLLQVTALNKTSFTTTTGKTIPVARGLFVQTKTAYMKYLLLGKDEL